MQVRPVILEGRLVRLEPLAPRHAPELLEAAQDDELWRYLPIPRPRTQEAIERWVAEAHELQARGEQLPFAVLERGSGRAIGSMRYLDIRRAHRGLEIGWSWISPRFQRTGVNRECKLLLLAHAFEALGCLRVQLKTDARNLRSQAAIERLGAVREGVLRRHMRLHDGFVRDSVLYSITDLEWPALKARLEARLSAPPPSSA